jgi:hypothetical protein
MNGGLVGPGVRERSRRIRRFVGRSGRVGVFRNVKTTEPTAVSKGGRRSSLPTTIEPFVSRRELARLMGVSIDTVDRLVAEGMPSVTWGRRTRRFRPSVAIRWAEGRERVA